MACQVIILVCFATKAGAMIDCAAATTRPSPSQPKFLAGALQGNQAAEADGLNVPDVVISPVVAGDAAPGCGASVGSGVDVEHRCCPSR